MLRIWEAPQIRPTMDIDMLGRTSNKLSDVVSDVIDILSIDVDPDGLSFSPEEITAENITDEAEYQGVRIRFPAKLDTMTLNMQLDIGYGDIIHPSPEESELPSILGFAAPPRIRKRVPGLFWKRGPPNLRGNDILFASLKNQRPSPSPLTSF